MFSNIKNYLFKDEKRRTFANVILNTSFLP